MAQKSYNCFDLEFQCSFKQDFKIGSIHSCATFINNDATIAENAKEEEFIKKFDKILLEQDYNKIEKMFEFYDNLKK